MAKITLTGVNNVAKALNRGLRIELNKLFTNQALRLKVGEIIVSDIKENVDFGEAAESTKKYRSYLERFNITDPAYDPERVKIVFGGHLLDDLAKNVRGVPTELTFEINHSDKKHPAYKTKTSRTKRNTYRQISEWLRDDKGYDYFQLTVNAQDLIVNEIRNEFAKLILSRI